MPAEFAYMTSAKNLRAILDRVRGAGSPPKFSLEFLKSLGYASSTDRPVIGVMKKLGFLTPDGVPTERYNEYRNASRSGFALAEGLREGWSDLFLADQTAHAKSSAQLTELFKSVSGKGEAVAQKMATTFKILSDMADWSDAPISRDGGTPSQEEATSPGNGAEVASFPAPSPGKVNLHHDIHIHLPATSDVSVFTAIFRALKAEVLD